MEQCPACKSSRFWGAPAGYHIINGLPVRCEVCKGHGIVEHATTMDWELSL